jgi:16S rRNA processing protein RimM
MSAHQQIVLVTLEGVTSRADSEALRGAFLCVTEDQRWSLPRGQYYMDDLAGLDVVENGEREAFGTVRRVVEGTAHDHLEIQCPDAPEPVLVPFIRQFVRRIDLTKRRIVLDLPPGLLEINRREEKDEE